MKKTFDSYLILDWKHKTMSVRKKKPKGLSPFNIPVKISIDVCMPDMKELSVKGEITLSETQVGDLVIESI